MKKHYLFLLSIFFLHACSSEQQSILEQYDKLVWSAKLAQKEGQFPTAHAYFEKAFGLLPNNNETDNFDAAEVALVLGKDSLAKELISSTIKKFNADSINISSFFGPYKKREIFMEIRDEREGLVAEYYSNLPYPKEIVREIEQLLENDQKARLGGTLEKMKQVDAVNISRLIAITKEYGWVNDAWLLLWHQRGTYMEDNPVWRHFKPLVDEEISEGKIRKNFWARFEDHESVQSKTEQIYGTYQNQYPITNIGQVDERRARIGLPPLWYMSEIYELFELPENYSPKNMPQEKKWTYFQGE